MCPMKTMPFLIKVRLLKQNLEVSIVLTYLHKQFFFFHRYDSLSFTEIDVTDLEEGIQKHSCVTFL